MKSNKGITLVALIITVIILLILSAITIDIAIDGKLFDRSKETVSEANNKLGEEQNRVDSLVNEWDNLETGTSGNTSGNEPEDTTPPTVEVEIERTTSNSITINVIATDNESGMIDTPTYTYYIKKSTESTYEEKSSNNTSSHIFTDLTQETTYDIKVEVAGDNAGNTGTGTAQATTKKVTSGLEQGAITFGSTTWSNNQASVTVSTNTSYTIEYQVNSIAGTWTTIENGGTVSGLNHGDTVYARLTDGINAGQYASTSITDGTAPTISSFTVTAYDTTSITVSASATDNQSGIYSYQFQYKLSTASSYTTAKTTVTSNGTCTYTYTGLADDTAYNLRVIVTDKANKASNKTVTQTTEKEIVTATVIDQNPTLYYGKEVENYGVTYDNTSGASNKWRIFYADENNIYLITDDYIHADYAPDSANNTIYINGNNYKLSMNNVYSDYTGAANIDSTLGNKWLSAYYPSNTTNRNTNIRAVAYMLDTDIWDPIYKNEYAEYAIGGPTLEMFCASYKDTHTNRYIECTANSTGYQVRWQGGSFANSISGIPANEFNSIYIKKDYSKANAMWLASPSAGNASHLMTAYYYRLCELRLLFQPQSWLSCASLSKI